MTTLALEWEPLAVLLDDGLEGLVRAHHAEVGVYKDEMPLDCNWEAYQGSENSGMLRILAARLGGKLIGYNSFMVLRHMHYWSTWHALGDAIFVDRDHRKTGAGIQLIDRAERDLAKEVAPNKIRFIYHDKAFLDYLRPILTKRGYTHQENILDKMVSA